MRGIKKIKACWSSEKEAYWQLPPSRYLTLLVHAAVLIHMSTNFTPEHDQVTVYQPDQI